jgi:hypothetical protein
MTVIPTPFPIFCLGGISDQGDWDSVYSKYSSGVTDTECSP